jgi:hypothetical protein
VADAVDAAVDADQAPFAQPPLDLIAADTGIQELSPGNDTVLFPRDPGEHFFDCPAFWGHRPH